MDGPNDHRSDPFRNSCDDMFFEDHSQEERLFLPILRLPGAEDHGFVVTASRDRVLFGGFLDIPFPLGENPHYFLPQWVTGNPSVE